MSCRAQVGQEMFETKIACFCIDPRNRKCLRTATDRSHTVFHLQSGARRRTDGKGGMEKRRSKRERRFAVASCKTKTKPTWLVDSALPGSTQIVSIMRKTRLSPLPSYCLKTSGHGLEEKTRADRTLSKPLLSFRHPKSQRGTANRSRRRSRGLGNLSYSRKDGNQTNLGIRRRRDPLLAGGSGKVFSRSRATHRA